jgi:hypothetical protein
MRRLEVVFNLLVSFFFLEVITFCSVATYSLISIESVIALFIFDFLFISLAFPLTKSLPMKLGLLTLGNLVGVFCNSFFNMIRIVGMENFGETFRVFYAISFPVLNVSWIVTFWSLVLASLPNLKPNDKGELKSAA